MLRADQSNYNSSWKKNEHMHQISAYGSDARVFLICSMYIHNIPAYNSQLHTHKHSAPQQNHNNTQDKIS